MLVIIVADHDKIQTQQSTECAEKNKYEQMRMLGEEGNITTTQQSSKVERMLFCCAACVD
eukprot:scaffold29974_cov60-Cyclotella_meneghiniana.AAC.7